MTAGQSIEQRYAWLRSCGYSHDAAVKAIKDSDKRTKEAEKADTQIKLL